MPIDSEAPANALGATPSRHSSAVASAWTREPPPFTCIGSQWTACQDDSTLSILQDFGPADLGQWFDRLSRASIRADRRNSPDLLAQIEQALRRPIDTVLCSVLDVDPVACLNSALAAHFPLELLAGVTLMGRLTGARRCAIVSDVRVPSSWFSTLRRVVRRHGVSFESIINDYPQADPTLLIYTMRGRRLRPGRLPTECGVIVFDAASAIALGRVVLRDDPMTSAPLVLRDHGASRSEYVIAPVGTRLDELARQFSIRLDQRAIRAGDLLRDVRVPPSVVLGGGELVMHISPPPTPINPTPCIRCGWCVDACPTGVHPATALEASQRRDPLLAERAGIEACIECGVCSYVCPSHLPLLDGIRRIKSRAQA